ncbi:hypothetical protein DASC09_054080 [Saccharomycopsis crataegensis]|uniref:Uncharacterized protein n=1 Tax=Saccharomycopsis crataegensis TaxID=43959 RepID=A0AAV5QVE5_9ASCO|nr:hypothetical protein DASC09_054080 [Saccharomycopsis crataegensis]
MSSRPLRTRKLSLVLKPNKNQQSKVSKHSYKNRHNNKNTSDPSQRTSGDLDSIEYIDRILKYYSQSQVSILDDSENEIDSFLSQTNDISSPSFLDDLHNNSSNGDALSTNTSSKSLANDDDYKSESTSISFPPSPAESLSTTTTSTPAPTLEDFIDYDDEEEENDNDNVSSKASSRASTPPPPTAASSPSSDNAPFYAMGCYSAPYSNRRVPVLDYRCHDKLNLALLEVNHRPRTVRTQPQTHRGSASLSSASSQLPNIPQFSPDLPGQTATPRRNLPGVTVIDYKTRYYEYLQHKYSAPVAATASTGKGLNGPLNRRAVGGNEMVGGSIVLNELF